MLITHVEPWTESSGKSRKPKLTQFVRAGPGPGGFVSEHMAQLFAKSNTENEVETVIKKQQIYIGCG